MQERVAIVTGAGSGIGLATARMLAERGYALVLAGRDAGRLGRAAAACGRSPRVIAQPTDMSRPDEVERLVRTADERMGRIDVLVNNAGDGRLVPIDETGESELRRAFAVNTIGPALAIHHAWPVFKRQKSGLIVNVSSVAALDPFPGFFAYGASKAAVNLLGKSAAKEGAAFGVRAFTVGPGAVETPLLRSLADERTVPPEVCLTPDDVARVIVRCIEGERDAANGRVIYMVRESAGVREWVEG
ncbi:MAG: SDR family oxidoreductase [Phycisphaerales bacterium]|nr:SDR family oxidoreductase [Phycisphaerales bacterium]